jgi:molecular chaperone GrpE
MPDSLKNPPESAEPAAGDEASEPGGRTGDTSGEIPQAERRAGQPPDALEAELEDLRRVRDEYYDRLLRQAAEFDNFRKRTERERRDRALYAAADLLGELLPVVDNLERAVGADAPEHGIDDFRRGVELIHKQLLELLVKHGVTAVEAVGTDFDPNVHEAVLYEPSPDHREGEVIEEFQRGYKLGDRLLRPSMVKVAKG